MQSLWSFAGEPCVSNRVDAIECQREGVSAERRGSRHRTLCVNVEVRLLAIAEVSDLAEQSSGRNEVAGFCTHRAAAHVR